MTTIRGSTDNFVLTQRPRYITDRPLALERPYAPAGIKPRSKLVMSETVQPKVPNPKPLYQSSSPTRRKPGPSAGSRVSRSHVLKRESVAKVNLSAQPATKKLSSKLKTNALMASAIVLLAFGGWVSFMGMRTNHQVAAQVGQLAAKSNGGDNTDVPDETEPDPRTLGSYTVDPSLPRFIRIAKTNTNARVKRLGVDTHNALLAPNNTHDAGWYENSAKPGEAGAMLIDGHVGFTKDGIFAHLKDLQKGDEISVERGDGQKFTYRVVGSQAYDADKLDMAKALVSAEPGKPGLNLITCTGKLTSDQTSYTQRLLVFAVQE
jgi:LPXTG-site transpeptidase (sortase) family protein